MYEITTTITCDIKGCDSKLVFKQDRMMPGHAIDHLSLPYGWNWINTAVVCPKHDLQVDKNSLADASKTVLY